MARDLEMKEDYTGSQSPQHTVTLENNEKMTCCCIIQAVILQFVAVEAFVHSQGSSRSPTHKNKTYFADIRLEVTKESLWFLMFGSRTAYISSFIVTL
jgi:hypothetical protein